MRSQVYFAECDGRIKIGFSRNPRVRMRNLATVLGLPVVLLGAVEGDTKLEKALHKKLRPYRIGGEWFRDCPDVRSAMQNCLNNFPAADGEHSGKGGYPSFIIVARALWPQKTADNLATRTKCDKRTVQFWLSGQHDPPVQAFKAIIDELYRRS